MCEFQERLQLTHLCLQFVSVAAVGNGDGSDLFVEIREANIPIFECRLEGEENCKVRERERERDSPA